MCHDIISLMVPYSVRIAKSSDFSILKKKKKLQACERFCENSKFMVYVCLSIF